MARYVTKNPFANDGEKRVNKSCEHDHPNGFNNDSCVDSISPSGRKLSCGCRQDYCNDEKAIQKLPVLSLGDGGAAIPGNATWPPIVPAGGDLVNHINDQSKGALKCICDEDKFCVNNECRGSACTTEFYGESGAPAASGGKSYGLRVTKGCAAAMPSGLVDNAETKKNTITMPDGTSVETDVRIWYCNNQDYCNNKGERRRFLLVTLFLPLIFTFLFW